MRIWTLLVLALALDGCSPPRARILAGPRGNDLVFTATLSSGPLAFIRRAVNLQPDLIRVDHEGRIAWRIERKRDRRCLNYGGGGPSAVFPLTYGKVPPCFTEIVRAKPLAASLVYRIAAVGGNRSDNGLGYFQAGASVRNIDSEPGRLAGWGKIESVYNVAAAPDGLENGVSSPTR